MLSCHKNSVKNMVAVLAFFDQQKHPAIRITEQPFNTANKEKD